MSFERKVCKQCCVEKNIDDFGVLKRLKSGKTCHRNICKCCKQLYMDVYNREYYAKNKQKSLAISKEYRIKYKNDQYVREKQRKSSKDYYIKNKDKCREKAKLREAKRRVSSEYRLRSNISRAVRSALFATSNSKTGKSFIKYVGYTIEELKNHLEQQFEPWMNWDNYGIYRLSWDDSNFLTWTWNIDHIIPQSKLPYDSMNHPNFKKCWALENLRPYAAKNNLLDSNRRENVL